MLLIEKEVNREYKDEIFLFNDASLAFNTAQKDIIFTI